MNKKISQLPQYVGTAQPVGDIPISIGGTTYRIDPSLLVYINPNPFPNEVVELIANDYKDILTFENKDYNGGFINYVLTDEDDNIRTGSIRFNSLVSGKYSFYEDIINSVGQTFNYTFSMTNDGTETRLLFYNNSSKRVFVTFQQKLMINPN